MMDDTNSTPPRPLIFSERMKLTSLLFRQHLKWLAVSLMAVWSSGATVSTSLTNLRSVRLDIANGSGKSKVAVTVESLGLTPAKTSSFQVVTDK